MIREAEDIRKQLNQELVIERAFWSYRIPDPDFIPDEILIEKTLINLDIEDINKLFLIFPKRKIRKIWNREGSDKRRAISFDESIISSPLF